MSASTTPMSSSINVNSSAFWELLWRTGGVQFVALCIVGFLIYGNQPQLGASSDTLVAFYRDHQMRILIAAVLSGFAAIYIMWFAAAIRVTLAEAGEDGWGAAATASSSAVGVLMLLLAAISAGLAYSVDVAGNQALFSGLNALSWAGFVLSSFVRAMLTMSAAFGLWRGRLISNGLFSVGVAIVVLSVLGGTTWLSSGIWAPDGAYSRFVVPSLGLFWALVVSWVVLKRPPARGGW